jgi:hypothetical protein
LGSGHTDIRQGSVRTASSAAPLRLPYIHYLRQPPLDRCTQPAATSSLRCGSGLMTDAMPRSLIRNECASNRARPVTCEEGQRVGVRAWFNGCIHVSCSGRHMASASSSNPASRPSVARHDFSLARAGYRRGSPMASAASRARRTKNGLANSEVMQPLSERLTCNQEKIRSRYALGIPAYRPRYRAKMSRKCPQTMLA